MTAKPRHAPTALERHFERCGTEFCSLHAAAPAMREALEVLSKWAQCLDEYGCDSSRYENGPCVVCEAKDKARAALRLAEGD